MWVTLRTEPFSFGGGSLECPAKREHPLGAKRYEKEYGINFIYCITTKAKLLLNQHHTLIHFPVPASQQASDEAPTNLGQRGGLRRFGSRSIRPLCYIRNNASIVEVIIPPAT